MCMVTLIASSCADEHSEMDADGAAGGASSNRSTAESAGMCEWPSDLAAIGSNKRDVCYAARAYLRCDLAGGGGAACPSDNFETCADDELGTSVSNCKSRCKTDEYVAICGGVGPGNVPAPPDGCRFDSANPGGSATYCCPCK